MAKDNLKTKFYKFIYLLDKENNKEEGKDTPNFDTWLKELKKEENNNIMIRILSNVLGSRNSESREHILHIKTATEMMLDNW